LALLTGKVAIVTGASRGLGKAIALGLAAQNAKIIVAARTEVERPHLPGTIHDTVLEIKASGGEAMAIKCDVSDEMQVRTMVGTAMERFGSVDILVNNAGIAFPSPVWEMPLKKWELVLRLNLTGAFVCIKEVLPEMMSRKTGSIINISSIQAQQKGSVTTGIAYGVSKAALERFTVGLAEELGPFNIAVNCIKPRGAVDTEGMRSVHTSADRARWDTPEMMVRAAVYLATQDGKGVSGLVATDEELCQLPEQQNGFL
jgi:citronellol/citronellal dehydrogenase